MKTAKTVLVVDAQGGDLGCQLIRNIQKEIPEVHIIAVGTNATATAAMLKAGADRAATGENSVVIACRKVDLIIGPIGMVIADAMMGEITPVIAARSHRRTQRELWFPSAPATITSQGYRLQHRKAFTDALLQLKKMLTEEAKCIACRIFSGSRK